MIDFLLGPRRPKRIYQERGLVKAMSLVPQGSLICCHHATIIRVDNNFGLLLLNLPCLLNTFTLVTAFLNLQH